MSAGTAVVGNETADPNGGTTDSDGGEQQLWDSDGKRVEQVGDGAEDGAQPGERRVDEQAD